MKILTFNIWDTPLWISVKRHERMSRLGAYLKGYEPDVICLQESFDTHRRELVWQGLGKSVYHMTSNDPDRTVTKYPFGSRSNMRRVFWFSRMDKTGGLVTFSKFPIKESKFTRFKLPFLVSPQERVGRKGFLETVLETPNGLMLVINTHLYSIQTTHGSCIRLNQLRQIFEKTKEKRNAMPTMLAGDLNQHDIAHHELFQDILKTEQFSESSEILGKPLMPSCRPENPLSHERFNNSTEPSRVDYVLLRGMERLGLHPASNDVLQQPESPLSDHDPVMVTLS